LSDELHLNVLPCSATKIVDNEALSTHTVGVQFGYLVATINTNIMKIEKVQRHFTKRLHGLKHLSYSYRLNKLGLPSLELHAATTP